MNCNIYSKIKKIYLNNISLYKSLNKGEKKIYNYIWNEITNMFVFCENEEEYSCKYCSSFSFSSELNLLLIKDGFNIKINKDDKGNYIYNFLINRKIIDKIVNSQDDIMQKTLQK